MGRWVFRGTGVLGLAAMVMVVASPAYDASHPQRVWAFHVTAPDTAYEVLASTDRLREPNATSDPGREARELFWIERGWSRAVRPTEFRSAPARVATRREGERWVIEAALPPGADLATLVLEGARIDSSVPPASGSARRRTLRRVVAGLDRARFEVAGSFPPGTRALLMCTTPGLPEESELASRAPSATRSVIPRTISFADVPVP